MVDTAEARQILAAAEEAAASNDFESAERLLRDAAAVQERDLGASHPDLANTLNNLGVVCERAGKTDEAEHCYRRAYAIATAAFPSDHPFVETAHKNLEDFCTATGRSIEAPASNVDVGSEEQDAAASEEQGADTEPTERSSDSAAPTEQDLAYAAGFTEQDLASVAEDAPDSRSGPERTAAPQAPKEPAPRAADAPRREWPPVARDSQRKGDSDRVIPWGAAVLVAISTALLVVGWMTWQSRPASDAAAIEAPNTSPGVVAVPPPAPPPASAPAPSRDQTPLVHSPSASSSAPLTELTVAEARLCQGLTTSGEWRCDPVSGPVAEGRISFYTRIAASRDTTIQHRWYFADHLQQNVMLGVRANPAGYRTYSRMTVNSDRAGEWRVELRTEDGRVLRQERFTVR